MAGFEESPFQMDEDLGVPPGPSLSQPESSFPETCTVQNGEHVTHEVPGDVAHLRSRMAGLKAEDNIEANTEEDEIVYEEDLDDKFDGNAGEITPLQITSQEVALKSETVTPPENFAPVVNKIYRLSFPQTQNFGFLKKLRLKSVLCLIPEEYPQTQVKFFEKEGIRLFQLGMSGNKEPFVKISSELITKALKIVINPENQPILIHCNRGKHRTGCLVGVLRRLQGWSLTIIFDEYRKFASPKERPMDQQFIELYDVSSILEYAEEKKFLPMTWV